MSSNDFVASKIIPFILVRRFTELSQSKIGTLIDKADTIKLFFNNGMCKYNSAFKGETIIFAEI